MAARRGKEQKDMRSRVAPLFLLLVAAAPAPASYAYRVDPAASAVAAKVGFMGLGSKTANFPAMTGGVTLSPSAMDRIALNVSIDATRLTAGDSVTTNRLKGKDFFDVANHPMVSFKGTALTMTGAATGKVAGQLTARGVTRPVTLAVTFSSPPAKATGRDPIGLTATTTINRRDFGMTAYSLVVGKKVAITIKTRMTPV
ncbi:MAG: hypothetical protein RLZZ58_999 [Pseudomonadota bacterium]